eukprot:CAMPEP_0168378532 /NCGR_PEP_ID=MMETSP0228-20121227/11385_1 /TAXON_ID=133427 /ORGANISM="Protoceratium reticulatum, Strain CCCM 535 (=CCMP 1889)" /LENGTH=118 /DNA_ID=CAMNT_0008391553 /DNA_START=2769 /DNA_END=3122 /DNA_ORIENTATION=+
MKPVTLEACRKQRSGTAIAPKSLFASMACCGGHSITEVNSASPGRTCTPRGPCSGRSAVDSISCTPPSALAVVAKFLTDIWVDVNSDATLSEDTTPNESISACTLQLSFTSNDLSNAA